jgi:hypothetical protein
MQVVELKDEVRTDIYLRKPIKRSIPLRFDQNLLLESEARKRGISIVKLVSDIIDWFFDIEQWQWYSGPLCNKYIEKCECCPNVIRIEFSGNRFFVLCRNLNCREPFLLKRMNDLIVVPRVKIESGLQC